MKKTIAFCVFNIIYFWSWGQSFVDARYNRAGISVLVDKKNEVFFTSFMLTDLGDKFYFNKTNKSFIEFPLNSDAIQNSLTSNGIVSNSLDNLRNLSSILERARYSLSDDKVNILKSTSRGIEGYKDEKWLKNIIENNYILVLSFRNIQTEEEIYNKKDIANTAISVLGGSTGEFSKRSREGYFATVDCFLFKIEMGEADYATFWNNWQNLKEHQNYRYKVILVSQSSCRVDSALPKGESDDLKKSLLKLGALQVLDHLGNIYLPIASKVGIENTAPIRAKVGRKEGVDTDQLFFIYEYRQQKNKSITTRRTGVIRARKVADNRYVATGNSSMSKFYKVNWGRYKTGMFIVQKNDKGIGVSIGMGSMPDENFYTRFSYSLTKSLKIASISQLRLYGEIGFTPQFIDESPVFEDYANINGKKFLDANNMNSIYYGVGLEKDFFVFGGFQISPFIGLTNEKAWYKNKALINEMLGKYELPKKYGDVLYAKGGVRIQINITYNLKIAPMIGFSTRTFSTSKGMGFVEKFKDYPNKIVINSNFTFSGLELKYEF